MAPDESRDAGDASPTDRWRREGNALERRDAIGDDAGDASAGDVDLANLRVRRATKKQQYGSQRGGKNSLSHTPD